MTNGQGHDSGVETDSDCSVTMSVESPRLHHHQLDEGITDAAAAGADLRPQDVQVVEISRPHPQQMDTEAVDENRPSTSRAAAMVERVPETRKTVDRPASNAVQSGGGKLTTRHNRTKSHRTQKIYTRRSPRKCDDGALLEAAAANDREKCETLLNNGAKIRVEDSRRRTALHFAATHRGSGDLVRLLLSRGADPNAQDTAGNTPLHLAICINNSSAIEELLRHGSDTTALDRSGRNPIELAKSRMKAIYEASRKGEVTPSARQETIRMISCIHLFLKRRGDTTANLLEWFHGRISASTTNEQFSADVSDVLASLQHLQL